MSILKCKQCPASRRHRVMGGIYTFECVRLGRPVNPEAKPYNCPLPNSLSTQDELIKWASDKVALEVSMPKIKTETPCIHHWEVNFDGYGNSICKKCNTVKDDYLNMFYEFTNFPISVRSARFEPHNIPARHSRIDYTMRRDDPNWDNIIKRLEG